MFTNPISSLALGAHLADELINDLEPDLTWIQS